MNSFADMGFPPTFKELGERAKREGIKEVAIKMLKDGASIDYIAKITELSKEQVEQLKKRL